MKIGSRGSRLALTQTNLVVAWLKQLNPSDEIHVEVIKTTGDRILDAPLASLPGDSKGLFVKEIEEALLLGTIDLAVHSLKDLPTELPAGLTIGAVPQREDPRDVLISRDAVPTLDALRLGAVLGTSSLRRQAQLKALRADLQFRAIRGNVDTRIRKMKGNGVDGIVLAAAGLNRMGLGDQACYFFPPEEMVPAVGQGALAIEIRSQDEKVRHFVGSLNDPDTRFCVSFERDFLESMGGGCQVPLGAHAVLQEGRLVFSAFLASTSGERVIRREWSVPRTAHQALLAECLAYFRDMGSEEILPPPGT